MYPQRIIPAHGSWPSLEFLERLGEKAVILVDEHKLNYLDIFILAENEHEIRGSQPPPVTTTTAAVATELAISSQAIDPGVEETSSSWYTS